MCSIVGCVKGTQYLPAGEQGLEAELRKMLKEEAARLAMAAISVYIHCKQ
jgi:hypothetical protein